MKINCIACGHNLDVDDAYDNFAGPVRCWICSALLEIRTEAGELRSVRLAALYNPAPQSVGASMSELGV